MKTDISQCARCGGKHEQVELLPFSRPVLHQSLPIATHYAKCPKTDEPILVVVTVQSK